MGERARRFGLVLGVVGSMLAAGCAVEQQAPPGPTSDAPVDEAPPAAVGQTGGPAAPGAPSSGAPTAEPGSGTPAPPAGAVVLASGDFQNKSYTGSGKAIVLRGVDGAPYLRVEALSVQNGPALHVLLTKEASPSTGDDVDKGSLDLGVLRSTSGNLTYTIPPGTDTSGYAGVIVYCVDYRMVFIAAPLTPAT
jgi:hypothetical protein